MKFTNNKELQEIAVRLADNWRDLRYVLQRKNILRVRKFLPRFRKGEISPKLKGKYCLQRHQRYSFLDPGEYGWLWATEFDSSGDSFLNAIKAAFEEEPEKVLDFLKKKLTN